MSLDNGNLQELYQAVILDHNKSPKNFRKIENATYDRLGHNPLCGDKIELFIKLDPTNTKVEDIAFLGSGCAISKASTSMKTQTIKGKTIEEAIATFQEFQQLLLGKLDPSKEKTNLGKLEIFSNIWKYPARVKCASLAWHTLKSTLAGENVVIKTE
ncbi:MAG: SUF system NifU family Fe-S cluster assembly protein [Bacteriovoracaceae bacterium]